MTFFTSDHINNLPPEKRPRERLVSHGVDQLSDLELLALMLGSGGCGKGIYQLAWEVLEVLENGADIPQLKDLLNIGGIGLARAALVASSLEFSRRRLRPKANRINSPEDILPVISHWSNRPQEYFLVLSLNGAHEVIRIRVVSQGILNRTIVHPREVFVNPLSDRAAAIICAHNHPSGNIEPSPEDIELTQRLKEVGEIIGIPLLDHIIFTDRKYYSFLEKHMI